MKTEELRQNFIEYFKKQGHTLIPSSSVIPHDDPTLLFINAGMNQFKDVFLGKSERDYSRAVTIQKCIRAGGKHNDLENVGHTARHLTFFEMLGNFSFGDYFKKEAIQFAWEVSTQVFGFDPDRIWPSVFREDDEAFELWTKYVPRERITRFDEKDNFWAMGDTGPCGPCSELYYDRGSQYSSARNPKEDEAGLRFLEFWNLVFMQFNRSADGTLTPLPKPSIDTGAGLERVISLKMNVDSVFETDVLRGIIAKVEEISGVTYDLNDQVRSPAFRVIADHLRCLSFAIADGAQPSNVERGYVLRKILRRTVRYARTLGLEEPFLAKVLPCLIELMGRDYPELVKAEKRIAEILTNEEEAFIRTLRRGGNILTQVIERSQSQGNQITGDDAFKLKDTYGLPLDEILLIAKDSELTVDLPRFQELEKEARERSKSAKKAIEQESSENLFSAHIKNFGASQFLGFDQSVIKAKINALVVNGNLVETMEAGEEGLVILDKTPFYASMGGQIGDQGILEEENCLFQVIDTVSPYKGVIAHQGKLEQGTLHVGALLTAKIDSERRQRIASNHTATHLLHWALHFILGEHIKQAGSVVEPNRLRFDFNHHKPLTNDEIRKVEDLVNLKIRQNIPVKWYEISYEEALKREDIKQFFGEKYGSQVRVVDADFSKELCGGTHVHALGDIGLFRILKESSIAAGVRRIEAVTALDADLFARESENQLNELAALFKVQPVKLQERIKKLLEENAEQAQELKGLKQEKMKMLVDSLESSIQQVNDISFLAKELAISQEDLRLFADLIIEKRPSMVLVLATKVAEDRCHMIVRVGDVLSKRINALELIKALSPIIEGSGGGKPNMAQAGGKAPKKISEALSKVSEFLLSK